MPAITSSDRDLAATPDDASGNTNGSRESVLKEPSTHRQDASRENAPSIQRISPGPDDVEFARNSGAPQYAGADADLDTWGGPDAPHRDVTYDRDGQPDSDVGIRRPEERGRVARHGHAEYGPGALRLRGATVARTLRTRTSGVIDLPQVSAGTERYLTVMHYGVPGRGPKAYLHAGLHADEIPGMLVLNHLMRRLNAADDRGEIIGECVVVPVANPIGASQFVNGELHGRFDLNSGQNFNRHYPDIAEKVAERAHSHLRGQPDFDKYIVRSAMRAVLNEYQMHDPLDYMRARLMELACDADIVLDVHCDDESVLHMYLGTPLWPEASDLHRQLGSEATLLAHCSGGDPFDEALSSVWWKLDDMLKDYMVEPNCLAATVEMRGQTDVSDELAARDADNLFRFLQRRGVVSGDPGALPEARSNPTPLEGVDLIKSPVSGVVTFNRHPGEYVRKNDTVAVIVDPLTTHGQSARTAVVAATSGVLFARRASRVTRPGQVLCKIAGSTPIPGRHLGALLHD